LNEGVADCPDCLSRVLSENGFEESGFLMCRSSVPFQPFFQAKQTAMRELNPLYNQIKDLKGRHEGLRGYL
jgi:hypothetical protein